MLPVQRLVLVVAAGVMLFGTPQQASARTLYLKVWKKVYESSAKRAKCSMCHPQRDKKQRNSYGNDLFKALGDRDVRDEEKIEEAIRSIGNPIGMTSAKIRSEFATTPRLEELPRRVSPPARESGRRRVGAASEYRRSNPQSTFPSPAQPAFSPFRRSQKRIRTVAWPGLSVSGMA